MHSGTTELGFGFQGLFFPPHEHELECNGGGGRVAREGMLIFERNELRKQLYELTERELFDKDGQLNEKAKHLLMKTKKLGNENAALNGELLVLKEAFATEKSELIKQIDFLNEEIDALKTDKREMKESMNKMQLALKKQALDSDEKIEKMQLALKKQALDSDEKMQLAMKNQALDLDERMRSEMFQMMKRLQIGVSSDENRCHNELQASLPFPAGLHPDK
jgi:hypothetical protein